METTSLKAIKKGDYFKTINSKLIPSKTIYPLDARTYVVSSDNKAFQPNMGGYSIYGSSLDGSDRFVRLEAYLAAERGSWKVDYCYM